MVVEDQFVPPRAPEDIGGPPDYAQFLTEGAEDFDATRFDCDAVNRALGKVGV